MIEQKGIKARKRVSRAGSEEYSLYIPKQWIKNWTDEQNNDKQVDMFSVGYLLVLMPKLTKKRIKVSVDGMPNYKLKQYIVSSYVGRCPLI